MRKDVLCLMVKNVFFTLCNSAVLSKLKPSWLSETVFVHILYKSETHFTYITMLKQTWYIKKK